MQKLWQKKIKTLEKDGKQSRTQSNYQEINYCELPNNYKTYRYKTPQQDWQLTSRPGTCSPSSRNGPDEAFL